MLVNRANAERQHGAMTRGSPFETLNALAKLLENGEGRRNTHVLLQLIGEMMCSLFVLFGLKSQLSESDEAAGRAMMKAALISRRSAADALCTKPETWLIEPPVPKLIRNHARRLS
jgi:hypothetical protein